MAVTAVDLDVDWLANFVHLCHPTLLPSQSHLRWTITASRLASNFTFQPRGTIPCCSQAAPSLTALSLTLLMTQEAMTSLMLIWMTQKMISFTTKMIKMPVTQRKRTILPLWVSKLQACQYHLSPRSRNVAARATKVHTSTSPPFIAFYWCSLGPGQVSESMSTIKTVNFIAMITLAAEMKRPQAKHMPKPGVEFEFSLDKPWDTLRAQILSKFPLFSILQESTSVTMTSLFSFLVLYPNQVWHLQIKLTSTNCWNM